MDGMLDRITKLADDLNLAHLRPQIAACERILKSKGTIDVAVSWSFQSWQEFISQQPDWTACFTNWRGAADGCNHAIAIWTCGKGGSVFPE